MPKKRRSSRRLELLSRSVEITSVSARMGIRVDQPRGQPPLVESGPWLELRGRLEEPVKGVSEVLTSLYPEDDVRVGTRRPASVGAIIGLKPQMSVVLTWTHREFDRLWALALSGQRGFAYLCFTKPHYGKAGVVSASFSTEGGGVSLTVLLIRGHRSRQKPRRSGLWFPVRPTRLHRGTKTELPI